MLLFRDSHYTLVKASYYRPFTKPHDYIGSFAPKSNARAYTPYLQEPSTLVCKWLEWNSMAALLFSPTHLSTHTQIPHRKGCSLLPSRLPRSCPVTCADSACLLAPASSISHADVPRTVRGEEEKDMYTWWRENRQWQSKEGKGPFPISGETSIL